MSADWRQDYDEVALVLQGGGALGSYQAGVVEGLAEAGIEPSWVAGVSIGAINAALFAGNAPAQRVTALRDFWRDICRQPGWLPGGWATHGLDEVPDPLSLWWSSMAAWRALMEGQNGFYHPRLFPPILPGSGRATTASWYDTGELRRTLERHLDFDRLNDPRSPRVSVGAVQVRTGNLQYFDNRAQRLGPQHIMASGALPPGFPAVMVDGEPYWDGGLVSNTPLLQVLGDCGRARRLLVFQVDLWSAHGDAPTGLLDVAERLKDIQYSSRTRLVTDLMARELQHQRALQALLDLLPPAQCGQAAARLAADASSPHQCNVIHLIYQAKADEGHAKDYEFSLPTMRAHWRSGLADLRASLAHPEWLAPPTPQQPFVTHDIHRAARPARHAA